MSKFYDLTGIDDGSLTNAPDPFTPSQKWQLVEHFIEQTEARLKDLRELERELKSVVIDQLDALDETKIKNDAFEADIVKCWNCGEVPFSHAGWFTTIPAATVYQARQTHLRLTSETPAALLALRQIGLGDKIKQTINPSDLSAWFRAKLEENEAFKLPDILSPFVRIDQYYDLRERKA